MGLFQKLHSIMTDVGYLNKDTEISGKKASYNVISEKKVLSVVRPKLVEQKIIVVPIEMHTHRDGNVTTLQVRWRIVDTESGEDMELASAGQGYSPDDKGAGMAQTYALKYLFLKMFQIITGDDPDYVGTEENVEVEKEAAKQNNVLAQIDVNQYTADQLYQITKSLNNTARINKLITPDQANKFKDKLDEVASSEGDDKHARFTRAFEMAKGVLIEANVIPEQAEIPFVGYTPDI